MRNTNYKIQAAIAMVACLPGLGRAQSTLSTILGNTPDGIAASAATLNVPMAVACDKNGVVYVALKGSHQVVKIDKTGTVYLVAGNGVQGWTGDGGPARQAQISTPAGVAVDTNGIVYIADSDFSVVRRVAADGTISTLAGTGKAGNSGNGGPAVAALLKNPTAVAVTPGGNVLIADTGNNMIRVVTPDGNINAFAGTGSLGSAGNGGPAQQAQLSAPAGLAVDGAGNVFIADTHNGWIRKVSTGGTITLWGGLPLSTTSASTTTLTPQPLANTTTVTLPTSLAIDKSGTLYFVESSLNRIRKITPDDYIGPFAGTGSAGGSGDGGLARFANLNVLGIAVDAQNNVLIADGSTDRVRIVTSADNIINSLAGIGLAAYNPKGLAVKGNFLYFSDTSFNRVRKLDMTNGSVSLVAGTGAAAFGGDGAAATAAGLNTPRGLAFDSSGNLYIADQGNNRIRKVTTDGNISTFVGTGYASSGGDGLLGVATDINAPSAVAIDSAGIVYFAEQAGHLVRKVNANNTVTTVAGNGTAAAPSAETGVAINQSLSFPQGLAVEPGGTLLIADSGNNRIRRVSSNGTITTVAGGKTYGSAGDGGPATSAQLKSPYGVTADAAGNIYIADTSNSTIRIVGTNGIINTIAGTSAAHGFNGESGTPATAFWLNSPYAVAMGPNSSLIVADTTNQRIRKLTPANGVTLSSNPIGLQVSIDGQTVVTPATVNLLPGSQHILSAPSPQAGPSGVLYVAPPAQQIVAPDGMAASSVWVNFQTQYALNVTAGDGGLVTPGAGWQNAGAQVTLQAAARSGFEFAGWTGDCQGVAACQVTMDGPRNVKAAFIRAQPARRGMMKGASLAGGGLSVPPVRQLSPNGVATIFGASVAAAGSETSAGTSDATGGTVPTELNGVCVMVGSALAPVLAVTPAQINFLVPRVDVPATIPVRVISACGTAWETRSDPVMALVQSASPEFFYFVHNADGRNPIAAVNGAGRSVGAPGLLAGTAFVPAKPGDTVTMYATGLGATNPPVEPGALPTGESPIGGDFWISVSGIRLDSASVQYAGASLTRPGVYELRVQLPAMLADGDLPVQISVNGFLSPEGAYLTVKN